MKKIFYTIVMRVVSSIFYILFFILALIAWVFAPVLLLIAIIRTILKDQWWESTNTYWLPTLEDGEMCFMNVRLALFKKR